MSLAYSVPIAKVLNKRCREHVILAVLIELLFPAHKHVSTLSAVVSITRYNVSSCRHYSSLPSFHRSVYNWVYSTHLWTLRSKMSISANNFFVHMFTHQPVIRLSHQHINTAISCLRTVQGVALPMKKVLGYICTQKTLPAIHREGGCDECQSSVSSSFRLATFASASISTMINATNSPAAVMMIMVRMLTTHLQVAPLSVVRWCGRRPGRLSA